MSSSRGQGGRGKLAAVVTAAGLMVSIAGARCTAAAPESKATPAARASGSQAAPGAQLWLSRYDGRAHTYPVPTAIAASPDGSAVFVTGWSRYHSAPSDYATVGYDAATGRQLWARSYAGPGEAADEAAAIAVSPDGRIVFVTGTSGPLNGVQEYTTIAYSASTGRQLWLRRYKGPDGYSIARALVVGPDGKTVFVTGYASRGYTVPGAAATPSRRSPTTPRLARSAGCAATRTRRTGTTRRAIFPSAPTATPCTSPGAATARRRGTTTSPSPIARRPGPSSGPAGTTARRTATTTPTRSP